MICSLCYKACVVYKLPSFMGHKKPGNLWFDFAQNSEISLTKIAESRYCNRFHSAPASFAGV